MDKRKHLKIIQNISEQHICKRITENSHTGQCAHTWESTNSTQEITVHVTYIVTTA